MATRKCKKPSANAVQVTQASDVSLIPPAPATMKVSTEVCLGCHKWKIGCVLIMSVVTGHGGGAVEFKEEHEEEEMSEDFNFDGITATTDNEQESSPEIGSEIDNDMGELCQRCSYPTARAPAKRAPPVKTVGKSKAIPKPTSSEH
ncbi:hypothetical protein PAXRUDRAFT_17022 [Paxillus rubicundulus Ve08.2h10]|uniref:Unplaced genomic scaffold scaffold_1859, whole genome shotgun sequence n=1 Tax=Paxillus rubicundulus Ve08.2h10 TaxID=930991 RepID=A0A0D0DJ77_9AGAM|nr:hypothetical protein PAXRUDRAFT_17022 [Paxillus rubicundulus Ve08.2h10]